MGTLEINKIFFRYHHVNWFVFSRGLKDPKPPGKASLDQGGYGKSQSGTRATTL
jgi:hypothetical protein